MRREQRSTWHVQSRINGSPVAERAQRFASEKPRCWDSAETLGAFRYNLRRTSAFTLIEIMIAVALAGLILIALNTVMFSMGELWGRGTDARLFEQHARAVTRFLDSELRAAVLPPAAKLGDTPISPQDISIQSGPQATLLTFILPSGSRLINWPDRPLPEVVCSLQAREGEGLVLLYKSRLETGFADNPPRETVISPYVTALQYDYYDEDFRTWSTETQMKLNPDGTTETPLRLRLEFAYNGNETEGVITLPVTAEGLPGE